MTPAQLVNALVVQMDRDGVNRPVFSVIIDAIEDNIALKAWSHLDNILEDVDPHKLRTMTVVAYLRSSFRVRHQLNQWPMLLARSMAYTQQHHPQNIDLFIGLHRP